MSVIIVEIKLVMCSDVISSMTQITRGLRHNTIWKHNYVNDLISNSTVAEKNMNISDYMETYCDGFYRLLHVFMFLMEKLT